MTNQIIGLAAAAPVGSESLRLGTQLAIGGALLLAVGGGAVTYHQNRIDGEAAAAVRRAAIAVPVEVSPAELVASSAA